MDPSSPCGQLAGSSWSTWKPPIYTHLSSVFTEPWHHYAGAPGEMVLGGTRRHRERSAVLHTPICQRENQSRRRHHPTMMLSTISQSTSEMCLRLGIKSRASSVTVRPRQAGCAGISGTHASATREGTCLPNKLIATTSTQWLRCPRRSDNFPLQPNAS